MPKGVKIKDLEIGTGRIAERGLIAVVKLRLFLSHGREIPGHSPATSRVVVDLGRRSTVAGVRYGIEGMKEGGRRHLVVSPHLAYGAAGIPGSIPPNAVLHCEVELLEVHPRETPPQSDYQQGRQLFVFHPGVAAESIPRWQFGLHESGEGGVSITQADPTYGWRYPSGGGAKLELDPKTAGTLIDDALAMPAEHPEACLPNEALWSDMTEKRNGATRDQATNTLCLTISVHVNGRAECYYALRNNSSVWLGSTIWRTISPWIEAELAAVRPLPRTP